MQIYWYHFHIETQYTKSNLWAEFRVVDFRQPKNVSYFIFMMGNKTARPCSANFGNFNQDYIHVCIYNAKQDRDRYHIYFLMKYAHLLQ